MQLSAPAFTDRGLHAEVADRVVLGGAGDAAVPHLIVPGPGGVPFSQAMAQSLAAEFEVTGEQAGDPPKTDKDGNVTDPGTGLLAQVGNYELVPEKKKG